MAFNTSKEALNVFRADAQGMTENQAKLADFAKIKIHRKTPRLVAAAVLRVALLDELG